MTREIGRRGLLVRVTAGGLVAALGPSCVVPAEQQELEDGLSFDGEWVTDAASLAAAGDDHGHIVSLTPIAILRAKTVDDVQKLLRYSNREGARVRARGLGHSHYGQAQTDQYLIETRGLDLLEYVQDDSVVVGAGATWAEVLNWTLPVDRLPTMLPDDLSHTVGGFLASGGLSASTARRGDASSNVVSLDVVTGSGERMVCSASERPDLFHSVLGGLGSTAIIVRARLKLAPRMPFVRLYSAAYEHLDEWLAALSASAKKDCFDTLAGQIVTTPAQGWIYMIEATVAFDRSDPPDDAQRYGDVFATARSTHSQELTLAAWAHRGLVKRVHLQQLERWETPHPALELQVSLSAAKSLLPGLLAEVPQEELADLPIRVTPIRMDRALSPRMRVGDVGLAIAVERFPGAEADLDTYIAFNSRHVERARAGGGAARGACALPLRSADVVIPAYAAQRQVYDPQGVLELEE